MLTRRRVSDFHSAQIQLSGSRVYGAGVTIMQRAIGSGEYSVRLRSARGQTSIVKLMEGR